jgi:hypothetical protein
VLKGGKSFVTFKFFSKSGFEVETIGAKIKKDDNIIITMNEKFNLLCRKTYLFLLMKTKSGIEIIKIAEIKLSISEKFK